MVVTETSIVMVSGLHALRAWQQSDKSLWIVNQDWQVLRADPVSCAAVLQGDEWGAVGPLLAGKTRDRTRCIGHKVSFRRF